MTHAHPVFRLTNKEAATIQAHLRSIRETRGHLRAEYVVEAARKLCFSRFFC